MDIDEFLEAEAGKSQTNIQSSDPENFITNRSIEDQLLQIRELIKQRKYIDAEKIYLIVKEHYANLEKQQVDERKTLHRQLCLVNKELIESLHEMKGELEKRTTIIRQLLSKAKEFMIMGDMHKANKIYLEVREMFKVLPEAFSEKKAELENEIVYFYSQMVSHFHKKNYSKLTAKGKLIEKHILTALGFLNIGDLDAGKKEYDQIYLLYTELPEGYLYEKSMIYNQILTLHRLTESGLKTDDAKRELIAMQKQLEETPKIPNITESVSTRGIKVEEKEEVNIPLPEVQKLEKSKNPKEKKVPEFVFNKKEEVKSEAMDEAPPLPKEESKQPEEKKKRPFLSFLRKEKTEEKVEATEQSNIEQSISGKKDAEADIPPLPSL